MHCSWKLNTVRPHFFDLLVRFSADSKIIGPTKNKKHSSHFIFFLPPDSYLYYWAQKNGSPIKICSIKHRKQLGYFQILYKWNRTRQIGLQKLFLISYDCILRRFFMWSSLVFIQNIFHFFPPSRLINFKTQHKSTILDFYFILPTPWLCKKSLVTGLSTKKFKKCRLNQLNIAAIKFRG